MNLILALGIELWVFIKIMSNGQTQELLALLSATQQERLQQLVGELNPIQRAWVSGYLAASAQLGQDVTTTVATQAPSATLTIVYASQTGNTKGVAQQALAYAQEKNIPVELKSIADIKPQQFKKLTHVLFLASTHGEGEPPEDAEPLYKFLGGKKASKLDGLSYSVLSLGDSSYEFFCQTGKDFDQRFAALGATSIFDRADCDVDYEADAQTWIHGAVDAMAKLLEQVSGSVSPAVAPVAGSAVSQYNKNNPFKASLSVGQKLTGRRSVKDIRHYEISLEGSDIQYQPGDALGVWFSNDAALVNEIIDRIGANGDEQVTVGEETGSLVQLLSDRLELTQLTPGFVKHYASLVNDDALQALVADNAALRAFIDSHQVVDVLAKFPGEYSAQAFIDGLRKITPRLYSIASSQLDVEDEVHLTVGTLSYDVDGKTRFGGASGFLARLEEDAELNVYVEPNDSFRLPANPSVPVIMVGPGTGVAPFRAFLQHRDQQGADGKNWLFFGNPNFTQDFLYQTEIQRFVGSGLLTNIDLAFSRDQAEKIYVQHRLLAQAEEVFAWLEQGAHVYVCGDATRMAKDVHEALITIVEQVGKRSREDAEAYIDELRADKRYQRDVY